MWLSQMSTQNILGTSALEYCARLHSWSFQKNLSLTSIHHNAKNLFLLQIFCVNNNIFKRNWQYLNLLAKQEKGRSFLCKFIYAYINDTTLQKNFDFFGTMKLHKVSFHLWDILPMGIVVSLKKVVWQVWRHHPCFKLNLNEKSIIPTTQLDTIEHLS